LKREIIKTADGSTTIRLADWDENYHSKHGAIQEAKHVFIKNGLSLFEGRPVSIMEIGFGTGLNAFITLLEAETNNQIVSYTGIEAYPVSNEEVQLMNYAEELGESERQSDFLNMHDVPWEQPCQLSEHFNLIKRQQFFHEITDADRYDLIYFDAFGYRVQPELWSTEIFRSMYKSLHEEGVLVTYAARGSVKRSMQEVGFRVEKLDGPPGKREMFRAWKTKVQ
jgi:tRNA U34 5-methylaminomethyl-2-thiouridine-forming methyltransferase MnmC